MLLPLNKILVSLLGEKNSRTSDNRNDFQYFIKKKKKNRICFLLSKTFLGNFKI